MIEHFIFDFDNFVVKVPRLNMAIPRPASDNKDMDPLTMVGILISHLSTIEFQQFI